MFMVIKMSLFLLQYATAINMMLFLLQYVMVIKMMLFLLQYVDGDKDDAAVSAAIC